MKLPFSALSWGYYFIKLPIFFKEFVDFLGHSAIFRKMYENFLKIQEKWLNFAPICHRIVRAANRATAAGNLPPKRGTMLNIVLVEPEIPQNTGNIARTCAATGSILHLVRPLGFDISESAVKRAGLDYWHLVEVREYENLDELFARNDIRQMRLFSTKAPRSYAQADYADGCFLFFGKETKGLPEAFLNAHYDDCVRLPMRANTRSLNLSNSVAVGVYEALRQLDFPGLSDAGSMKPCNSIL